MPEFTLEISSKPVYDYWNEILASLPNAHILQSSYWAEIKAEVGWQAEYLTWKNSSGLVGATALVLARKIPGLGSITGSCVLYSPRGPVLDWSDTSLADQVLKDLLNFGRMKKAVFIKIDPDVQVGRGLPGSPDYEKVELGSNLMQKLISGGWQYSRDQIQFKNTVLLDLSLDQDALLGRMKQKTRYNIALAGRKGVVIRRGDERDFKDLYQMYAVTAIRDGFTIRDESYYTAVWTKLFHTGVAIPLLAESEGKLVSGMVLFIFANRAYYFYGMSSGEQREKMPNHLLQWEAIRVAQEHGCLVYDFWGAPDSFNEKDPMWGVYRFKEGFTGQTVAGLGAWDHVINPVLFALYQQILPPILNIMRWVGRKRVTKEINQ